MITAKTGEKYQIVYAHIFCHNVKS